MYYGNLFRLGILCSPLRIVAVAQLQFCLDLCGKKDRGLALLLDNVISFTEQRLQLVHLDLEFLA